LSSESKLHLSRHFASGVAVIALFACRTAESVPAPQPTANAQRIYRDIAYLSDDRLEGRGTGTVGNDSAAAYIARSHSLAGLRP
jgi:hypothetical protein